MECAGIGEEAVDEGIEFLHLVRHLRGEIIRLAEIIAQVVEFMRARMAEPTKQLEVTRTRPDAASFVGSGMGVIIKIGGAA